MMSNEHNKNTAVYKLEYTYTFVTLAYYHHYINTVKV